jgi:hypothetical protein
MSWNERPQKVTETSKLIYSLYSNLSADQKRTEGKKAAGSDSDDDRPKKKSAKANGKAKTKR